jgi:hypothetical protein
MSEGGKRARIAMELKKEHKTASINVPASG